MRKEKKGLFLSIVMGVFWHMAGPVFSFSLRGFREITRKDPVTFSGKVEAPNSFAAAAAPEPSRRRKQLLCCLRNVFQSTKKPKKKGKQSRWKTLFTLQEEERSVLAWQRHRFSAWDELQRLGVALWWRSCHEPLKKTHTVKLKSSQLNSTEPDPVAEARCASRETQINTCWELVFYRDNLWLCMPASKNTPPQGARPTRNIPASLEIWEHRGGKKAEEDTEPTACRGRFTLCSDA